MLRRSAAPLRPIQARPSPPLSVSGAAIASVFGFATLDPAKAQAIEKQYQETKLRNEVQASAGQASAAGIESSLEGAKR